MSPKIEQLISSHRSGLTMSQPFYTDADLFAHDMETIFRRHWIFAGLETHISKPGDFRIYKIGPDEIILLRDSDGSVNALFNVCSHRGSRLCLETQGRVKTLVCPYHQWVFRRNGTLQSARLAGPEFDKSQHGLATAHVKVVEGLIFICLAEEAPDFTDFEDQVRPHLEPLQLSGATVAHHERYDLRANWKLIVENFHECYHCPGTHPEYCTVSSWAASINSPTPQYHDDYGRQRAAQWQEWGLPTHFAGMNDARHFYVGRMPQREGFTSQTMDGKAVGVPLGRLPSQDVGYVGLANWPNLFVEAPGDYAVIMQLNPMSPNQTVVEMYWLVNPETPKQPDFSHARLIEVWKATAEQDWELSVNNQSGIESTRYRPGPYVRGYGLEDPLIHFTEWYLRQISAV
jgi:Rieske 2Fe-2S family protein